jgi:sugar-specific transcriptional regulator TrmB
MSSSRYVEIEEIRRRIREMSDRELREFGEAARSKCRDKSPNKVFVIQLEEACLKIL